MTGGFVTACPPGFGGIGTGRLAVLLGLLTLCLMVDARAGKQPDVLRLATTTSTYETGLLDHILPPFEKQQNAKVHVISAGTGKAMAIARAGDVDVILVHAREAEDDFLREGHGIDRHDVMANDFVIVGPLSDPARISGMRETGPALRRIAEGQHLFVSRGDDSGTHKKEAQLWAEAGIKPRGRWRIESGQGMSSTLTVADEKNGYILVDRASYLTNRNRLRLRILVEGDPELLNPYGVIAVNPARHPHVKAALSEALTEWLVSPECRRMIGAFSRDGVRLFRPATNTAAGAGRSDGYAE